MSEPIGQSSQPEAERKAPTPSQDTHAVAHESPGVGLESTPTAQRSPGAGAARSSATPTAFEQSTESEPSGTSQFFSGAWTAGFSPAEGYEAALDALLSLGADKGGPPAEPGREPGGGASPDVRRVPQIEGLDISSPGNHTHTVPGAHSQTSAAHGLGLSESRILGLLRYYRYEVAPWVRPLIPTRWHCRGSNASESLIYAILDKRLAT